MEAKALGAKVARLLVGLKNLLAGQAVLGFFRLSDNRVAFLERAGIVAEANQFREFSAKRVAQKFYVGDVVKVNDVALLVGQLEFFRRSFVRREDYLLACDSAHLAKHKLWQAGTVAAAAAFLQDFKHVGVGHGLHRKVLGKFRKNRKCLGELRHVVADGLFVVKVKGRGEFFCQLQKLVVR